MDNLFLEEFVNDKVDPNTIKEIQIFDNTNTFDNNNVLEELDDYDINTETIIHKQENLSENNNEEKIFDISSLYTQDLRTERLLISYEDMNESYVNFNGSYECQFTLNKNYKNVIGFRLDRAIYENIDHSLNGSQTNIYLDVIINNIPKEVCINNLKGYNILSRLHYENYYGNNASGVQNTSFYSTPNYFYPINLNKLNLSLKYNHKDGDHDLIDLQNMNNKNFDLTNNNSGLKFSFEFELTILNK